ncbi:MAG TPA: tetratricopeptide repeat protein [Woeseiaceae bacterium]|nr:tetratricopeptide repeat protein [Woeseiaceae bacterium]
MARAIRVELVAPPTSAREAAAIDPQTYELLLLGRHHLHRWKPEGFVAARDYLTRAVERDPGHSAAQAWLAMAYLGIAFYEIEPRAQAYANASAAARAALELDPLEGQALVVLGFEAYAHDWNWPLAEHYFRRALETSPNTPWPHWGYAHLLDSLGRHEEAIAESRLALRLDPASLFMHYARQFVLWNAGRYAEAFAACEDARERMPDRPRAWYQCAKEVYERTGQYERAIEMRAALSNLGPEAGYYYKIEAGSRNIGALRRAWRERGAAGYWTWVKVLRDDLGSYHAVNRAAARAQLGEVDEAIAVLEDGFRRRDQSLTALGTEPLLDPLRGDPRFADLLRRMRLPE